MKLVVRIFALFVVIAGVAAAAVSAPSAKAVTSHQAATGAMPTPGCVPGVPTCGPLPK